MTYQYGFEFLRLEKTGSTVFLHFSSLDRLVIQKLLPNTYVRLLQLISIMANYSAMNDKSSSTATDTWKQAVVRSLLNPPPSLAATNLTADNFVSFFMEESLNGPCTSSESTPYFPYQLLYLMYILPSMQSMITI